MIKPTIHLNGTSREALHEGYRVAYDAVSDALAAVRRTHPNGRDYYPQDKANLITALAEHYRREGVLEKVLAELEELCLHTVEP